MLSNCKANGQTSSVKLKMPCNIYFANFSITIAINKQMSPKNFFIYYISHYKFIQVVCFFKYVHFPLTKQSHP